MIVPQKAAKSDLVDRYTLAIPLEYHDRLLTPQLLTIARNALPQNGFVYLQDLPFDSQWIGYSQQLTESLLMPQCNGEYIYDVRFVVENERRSDAKSTKEILPHGEAAYFKTPPKYIALQRKNIMPRAQLLPKTQPLQRTPSQSNSKSEDVLQKVRVLIEQGESQEIFLTRAIDAIVDVAARISLVEPSTAPSNYEVLLRILEQPEVLDRLKKDDPLAAARCRGLRVKQQLIEAEGGCVSSEEAAKILSISRQGVDKRRRNGKLIAISRGQHGYLYPIWQFDVDRGQTLPGLEEVLSELKNCDAWMQVTFMLNPCLRLEDEATPLDELRRGKLEEVRQAASVFGEHGAD